MGAQTALHPPQLPRDRHSPPARLLKAAAGPPGRTERRGLPFMSRNEARTAAAPAAKTDFPGVLTCRGAGSGGSGEKRRDPKQPRQAPALHVPPARSGRGREGEAGKRGRGGRGAGTRVLPWRHLAGLWSPEGAEPLSSTEAKGRCAARPSCREQRRRWAAASAGRLPAFGPRPESPAL